MSMRVRFSNMNICAWFIIFLICAEESKCFKFPEATIINYNLPIINFRGVNETIVYISDDITDDTVISSLLSGLYSEQSVTVSSGKEQLMAKLRQINRDPNIIILINNLELDDLKSDAFQVLMKISHWVPMYLVITTKNNLTCENGTFSKDFINNAQEYLSEIWHKYRIARVIVSFPYTCPDNYIIYGEKKPSKKALYDRTIKLVKTKDKTKLQKIILENTKYRQLTEGFPLTPNIFERFPTSISECSHTPKYLSIINLKYTSGFCGLDGLVMYNYISHYRFNVSEPDDEDEICNIYGYVEPKTREVSGSLGCIVRGQIDISFNSRFMVPYKTERFFYLHYITVDSLAVVLKRPVPVPLWHYVYNTYDSLVDIVLCILILILGIFTWTCAWIFTEIRRQTPRSFYEYILNAWTSTVFGFSLEKNRESFRILTGSSLFCSVIIIAYFQGNVNYQFTTRTRYKEVKTLRQLYASQFTIYTSSGIYDMLINIQNPEDQLQVAYFNQTKIRNNSSVNDLAYLLHHPQDGTLLRSEDTKFEILLNFTDDKGSPRIYVVDEPIHKYYVSYIARTGFMFIEETICFMMRLLEAGLPSKYYIWTRRHFKLVDSYPKTGPEPRPFTKTKLQHQRGAFGILMFGYFAATLSFIVEWCRGRRSSTRN